MHIERHCPNCRAHSLQFEVQPVDQSTTLVEVQAYCEQCHCLFGFEFDLYKALENDEVTMARFDPPDELDPT